jgi:cytochrome c peroxidase
MAGMRLFVLSACVLLFLVGCSDSDSDTQLDRELRGLISSYGLSGDPAEGLDLPAVNDPVAVLGRRLFFSKSLGGDRDSACVTCHHPALGGGDALALSIGVGADDEDVLGPGRTHPDGDFTVPRNAPTTFNLGVWEKGLFWDSRVEQLEDGIRTPDSDYGTVDLAAGDRLSGAQARFPVTSVEEMRGFEFVEGGTNDELRAALEERLENEDGWAEEFETAFGDPSITYERIAVAIGAYEESQVFTDSPWRAYVKGDNSAIPDTAKRGALLFFNATADRGFGCTGCHAGDFFTDESFHSVAAPQIGRGKGDGASGTSDFGLARETADRNDRYAFRTPTLLNVATTGPYFHSGAYDTLEDTIRHHLDPQAALDAFDPETVPLAAAEDFDRNAQEMTDFLDVSGRVIVTYRIPLEFDEVQISDVVAFLETLTDPCVTDRACLDPWVADPEIDDVDGNLLVAVDEDGNPL